MQTPVQIISLVLFCAVLGAAGQLMFKLSAPQFSLNLKSILTNYKFLIGVLLYASATILFIFALKQGNLSVLYPIIATSYIWVTILSMIFLKESFPVFKWAGIVLIILGVYIIVK